MQAKEFVNNLKAFIRESKLREVKDILERSLKDKNEAVLMCAEIGDYLRASIGKRVESDKLRIQKNDLLYRILEFLEILQFPDNWSLPEELVAKYFLNNNTTQFIAKSRMYECDRRDNAKKFFKWFSKSKEKIQFYVIHGEEKDSPYGFYQRISSKEILSLSDNIKSQTTPIELDTLGEGLNSYKIFVLRELFSSLKIDVSKIHIDSKIKTLLQSPIIHSNDTIVVGFKKYLSDWSSSSSKVIDWLVNDFCQEELPTDSPKFIFFLQLIYPEADSFFSRIRTNRIKRKCRKELDHIEQVEWFDELQKVDKEDINRWLDNLSQNKSVKDDWFKLHFEPNKTYHMSNVEYSLSKIIEAFNTQIKEKIYNSYH